MKSIANIFRHSPKISSVIAAPFLLMIMIVLLNCCDCMADGGEWSLSDEVYACGTSGMSLEELASAGVTLLSHAPWGWEGKTAKQVEAFLDEAHRYGIKVIPYVTLYKVIDSRETKDGYHTKDHPFFKELDLVEHPEWALIDEKGNIRRPFDCERYRSGVHQSCTNVAGLAQAYVRGVKNLMDIGFDGLFVDNAIPYPTCYGPKYGKHKHIHPDKDNVYTYHLALKQVYDLVKQYGDDKVVMLNTGTGPCEVYADCDDGTMVESYLCSFVEEKGKNRWHTFDQVIGWAKEKKHVDYIASGKALVALSYLGRTKYSIKDDAFYSSACGKMSRFLWTSNVWRSSWTAKVGDRRGNDLVRLLYRVNLKKPLTAIKEKDGVTYRVFASGTVAVNPGDSYLDTQLPAPVGVTEVCDLYSGIVLPVSSGEITVRIPPESGRLYICPDAVFASYLKECSVAAKGIQQRLNKLRDNTDIPANDTIAASVETRLRQWLKENLAIFESLPKAYKIIPLSDNRGKFIAELAIQQSKLPKLIDCQKNDIIWRRLQNLREYSGRVLSLATGITLTIDAPQKAMPGDTAICKLSFDNNKAKIQGLQFELEVPYGWKVKSVNRPGKSDNMDFKITIPETATVSVPATLSAIASFEYKNKQDEKLQLTMVQTHGLQIADKKIDKTEQEEITLDQQHKLHADPKKE